MADDPNNKWAKMDEATREKEEAKGLAVWAAWYEKNKAHIVDMGSPLGETKKIDPKGITDITNMLCAYCIVKAESHEAAAKMFLNHPHFAIFPGDGVEIMECLPMPTEM